MLCVLVEHGMLPMAPESGQPLIFVAKNMSFENRAMTIVKALILDSCEDQLCPNGHNPIKQNRNAISKIIHLLCSAIYMVLAARFADDPANDVGVGAGHRTQIASIRTITSPRP
jgi:hypothetical protein